MYKTKTHEKNLRNIRMKRNNSSKKLDASIRK